MTFDTPETILSEDELTVGVLRELLDNYKDTDTVRIALTKSPHDDEYTPRQVRAVSDDPVNHPGVAYLEAYYYIEDEDSFI